MICGMLLYIPSIIYPVILSQKTGLAAVVQVMSLTVFPFTRVAQCLFLSKFLWKRYTTHTNLSRSPIIGFVIAPWNVRRFQFVSWVYIPPNVFVNFIKAFSAQWFLTLSYLSPTLHQKFQAMCFHLEWHLHLQQLIPFLAWILRKSERVTFCPIHYNRFLHHKSSRSHLQYDFWEIYTRFNRYNTQND